MGFVAERVAQTLREHGEQVTLRRQLTDAPTFVDVAVWAKRIENLGTAGQAVADQVVQSTVRFRISDQEIAAAGWPGPPKAGDRIVAADATFALSKDADTRRDRGEIVMHILLASGLAT